MRSGSTDGANNVPYTRCCSGSRPPNGPKLGPKTVPMVANQFISETPALSCSTGLSKSAVVQRSLPWLGSPANFAIQFCRLPPEKTSAPNAEWGVGTRSACLGAHLGFASGCFRFIIFTRTVAAVRPGPSSLESRLVRESRGVQSRESTTRAHMSGTGIPLPGHHNETYLLHVFMPASPAAGVFGRLCVCERLCVNTKY